MVCGHLAEAIDEEQKRENREARNALITDKMEEHKFVEAARHDTETLVRPNDSVKKNYPYVDHCIVCERRAEFRFFEKRVNFRKPRPAR